MKSNIAVLAGLFMIAASINIMGENQAVAQVWAFLAICAALVEVADAIRSRKE